MRNETEESVIVDPGLQIYMGGTCRVVPGVQHSEGVRSQAQWDIRGCYWSWFQQHANWWVSSTFHMFKRFPVKNIFIIIQLPWAIHRFAFHWQDLKIQAKKKVICANDWTNAPLSPMEIISVWCFMLVPVDCACSRGLMAYRHISMCVMALCPL